MQAVDKIEDNRSFDQLHRGYKESVFEVISFFLVTTKFF